MSQSIIKIIEDEYNIQVECDCLWDNSPYKKINELKANNVGKVGEKILLQICIENNIKCTIDGSQTKQIGGGVCGDGFINNKSIEVKTARLGKGKTFQFELGEHPWNANYMSFVCITPKNIYLCLLKNFTKDHYLIKNRTAKPYFNKKITRRKETSKDGSGAFKLTLREQDIIDCKNKIIITNNLKDESIKNFIENIINDF